LSLAFVGNAQAELTQLQLLTPIGSILCLEYTSTLKAAQYNDRDFLPCCQMSQAPWVEQFVRGVPWRE
jgi:hypothetical protein